MSAFSAALASTGAVKRVQCSVGRALAALDTKSRADVTDALENPAVHGTRIAAALTHMGHTVSSGAVQRHRRNTGDTCTCHTGHQVV